MLITLVELEKCEKYLYLQSTQINCMSEFLVMDMSLRGIECVAIRKSDSKKGRKQRDCSSWKKSKPNTFRLCVCVGGPGENRK